MVASGLAFVSEYALGRFRADFPGQRAARRAIPNGLDMQDWSAAEPKDKSILCVGRALRHKGHMEAMAAITRVLPSRPEWSARFMARTRRPRTWSPQTVNALRAAAEPFGGRIRVNSQHPLMPRSRRRGSALNRAWAAATRPETLGRTALEAMASGAALITWGGAAWPRMLTLRGDSGAERWRCASCASLRNCSMRPTGEPNSPAPDASASTTSEPSRDRMDEFIDAWEKGADKRGRLTRDVRPLCRCRAG